MPNVETIVVGGGIAATVPFTLGQIPVIVSGSPPAVTDSIMRQVTVAAVSAIIVGATDPESTAAETFRTSGGIISAGSGVRSTRIGRAVTVAATSIGIGDTITLTTGSIGIGIALTSAAAGNVLIGNTLTANDNSACIVTAAAGLTVASGQRNVSILGAAATFAAPASLQTDVCIVGTAQGWAGEAMKGNTYIGYTATNPDTMGVVIGQGDNAGAAFSRSLIRAPRRSLTANAHGADFYVQSGVGTGIGTISGFIVQTPTLGVTGSVAQVLATRLTITGDAVLATVPFVAPVGSAAAPAYTFAGDLVTGMWAPATGEIALGTSGVAFVRFDADTTPDNTRMQVWDVGAAALQRVSIGAADSGGSGFRVLRVPN